MATSGPGPAGLKSYTRSIVFCARNRKPALDDSLTPVYPTTEGVQQGRLRNLVSQAMQLMRKTPPAELLPVEVLDKLRMPSLAEALEYLHKPPTDADTDSLMSGKHPCQQRLAFEELLAPLPEPEKPARIGAQAKRDRFAGWRGTRRAVRNGLAVYADRRANPRD